MTSTSPGNNASAPSIPPLAAQAAAESAIGDLRRMEVQAGPAGTNTLRVLGEIDLVTVPRLRSRAMAELARTSGRLILDLRRVSFLGSSGLAVLLEIRQEALRHDIGLQLVTASRAVLRPLIATGLIELFDVDAADRVEPPPRQGGD